MASNLQQNFWRQKIKRIGSSPSLWLRAVVVVAAAVAAVVVDDDQDVVCDVVIVNQSIVAWI